MQNEGKGIPQRAQVEKSIFSQVKWAEFSNSLVKMDQKTSTKANNGEGPQYGMLTALKNLNTVC